MITTNEVTQALELLGSNADEVAQSLLNKGCLARYCKSAIVSRASNCPIAVYLKNQFPEYNFSVGPRAIALWPPDEELIDAPTMNTPRTIQDFVFDFDQGNYPSLYAPEEDSDAL